MVPSEKILNLWLQRIAYWISWLTILCWMCLMWIFAVMQPDVITLSMSIAWYYVTVSYFFDEDFESIR